MPHRRLQDPEKLRRLMDAVLMIEADIELPALLRHIVEEACSLVGARYGALGVLNEDRTQLEEFLTVGLTETQERTIGSRPTGRGVLGLLITDPEPLRVGDLAAHPDRFGFPEGHPPMGSFLGVPIRVRASGAVYGNLYLTDKQGADEFSDEDEALAESLAVAAGIAIENTRLHDRVRVLSVLDDRDRIAHDLHDRVIQRLFASGLTLQSASRMEDRELMVARIDKVVDDLDETITEIRSAIFELSGARLPGGIRHAVLALVAELVPVLGFRPDVRFDGPIDNVVSPSVADHLLAVLRESLTNAGKHAQADRIVVTLSAEHGVTLTVTDDGVGLGASPDGATGLGLRNLRSRAEKLGGTFAVGPAEGGGTRVVWSVPL